MPQYVYSSSPHARNASSSTKRIMIDVCIALIPACIVGCILLSQVNASWGLSSLLVLVIATLSAVASEFVYLVCCKKNFESIVKDFDFTSVVTGLLVGMNMYATSKWFAVALASVFAIVVVKMLFGGTGKNVVNPAIAGRVFAFISFGSAFGGKIIAKDVVAVSPITGGQIVGATPLQSLLGGASSTLTNLDLFLGTGVVGCIGEISKVALLLGGIYLVIRGVIKFQYPLVYILVTGVTTVVIALAQGKANAFDTFLPSILSGGLVLGAIFMATDYVTTPNTRLGNYLYFVFLGLITAVLRVAVKAEVVSFAILLGNLIVPLIDQYVVSKPFGWQKSAKEVK